MEKHADARIRELLSVHWSIGEILSTQKLLSGLVNDTYLVSAGNGEVRKYIFQNLGTVFSSPSVVIDQAVIGQYLEIGGIVVPKPILSNTGLPFAYCDNMLSKLCCYIDHDTQPKESVSDSMVESAGTMLGILHSVARRINYVPRFKIPHFHDTNHYKDVLIVHMNNKRYESKAKEIELIVEKVLLTFRSLSTPVFGEEQLIHGDPKLDNFLFRDGTAYGVIDLDTFMIGSVLIDLGDAFRSWMQCPSGQFDFRRARIAHLAYVESSGNKVSFDCICNATAHISLELTLRFLIDYFEESYFKWDPLKFDSSAMHNLARAKFFLNYARSIVA